MFPDSLSVKVGLERKMQGDAAQALQGTSEKPLADARDPLKESA
jgi:hypothetical protein